MADCGQAPFGRSYAFLRFVAVEDVRGDSFVDRLRDIIDAKVSDPAWMEGYDKTRLEDAATLVRKGVMGEDAAAELLGVDLADLRRALADLA